MYENSCFNYGKLYLTTLILLGLGIGWVTMKGTVQRDIRPIWSFYLIFASFHAFFSPWFRLIACSLFFSFSYLRIWNSIFTCSDSCNANPWTSLCFTSARFEKTGRHDALRKAGEWKKGKGETWSGMSLSDGWFDSPLLVSGWWLVMFLPCSFSCYSSDFCIHLVCAIALLDLARLFVFLFLPTDSLSWLVYQYVWPLIARSWPGY